jgi:hypothetical protein
MSRTYERRWVFREVNERILEVDERFGAGAERCDVFCECGAEGCVTRIEVPARLYDDVRKAGRSFVVAVGHERLGDERVVAEDAGYRVVVPTRPHLRLATALPETA